MAKIAILGTRESGKTVLMTVLAKRYQNRVGMNRSSRRWIHGRCPSLRRTGTA